jgi:polyvinyl alcohol dehydrogenase (cytochrome)
MNVMTGKARPPRSSRIGGELRGGLLIALVIATGCAAPQAAPEPIPHAEAATGILERPSHAAAQQIFALRCASCHLEETGYAPSRAALAERSVPAIVSTLTDGSMQAMAEGLSEPEIRALALYLSEASAQPPRAPEAIEQAYCADRQRPIDFGAGGWNGFGRDLEGSRFHPDPGIRAADVPRLRLRWAFGLDGGIHGQPTIVGDRVFVSSVPGQLYSIDAETGCVFWSYLTAAGDLNWGAGSRATVTVGPVPSLGEGRYAAYIGDDHSFVHAIDAVSGRQLWRTRIETHPGSRVTGSPVLHDGVLFVPVSSLEEAAAGGDNYECCTFRGSIVALDAGTGDILWKSYSIPEEPRPTRLNAAGAQMYGPAGAAIWSTPTIDRDRGLLYATTGNSYTEISVPGANAVLAFDLASGDLRWARQVLADDNYIAAGCNRPQPPANCPDEVGPDYDYGSAAIIRTLVDGRQLLISADKGGMVYAMDPDRQGAIVWRQRVGAGSALGGVQWGMAADDEHVYVAVSDVMGPETGRRPGLTALRITTGEVVWHTPAPPPACSWTEGAECSNAMSAAVSLIPGAVFAGSLDGHIRAFSTADGSLLWSHDTARDFQSVNGVPTRGGSLDGAGVTFANGTMFMTSGYERFGRRRTGNALLAFTVDGR